MTRSKSQQVADANDLLDRALALVVKDIDLWLLREMLRSKCRSDATMREAIAAGDGALKRDTERRKGNNKPHPLNITTTETHK